MTASRGSTPASSPSSAKKEQRRTPAPASPSSSIVLLSPSNRVLLLHRVRNSSAFASAHVFPGGNLSSFHEGPIPELDSPERHQDGEAYRLAAIRETFEESGILLARKANKESAAAGKSQESRPGPLLDLPAEVREAGRKAVHGNSERFVDWLREKGGVADIERLIPFTRWITPTNRPKRFSTQMYLYMLPLSSSDMQQEQPISAVGAPGSEAVIHTPTHDGGLEHTAATFDDVSSWLSKAHHNEIILFPPQLYLLTILSQFLTGPPPFLPSVAVPSAQRQTSAQEHYQAQRDAMLAFAANPTPGSRDHPTGAIRWADKVMGTAQLFVSRDGRSVLGLDKPGWELKGTGRGGDWERVVLARFAKEGMRDGEVRWRKSVLAEERGGEGEPGGEEAVKIAGDAASSRQKSGANSKI